MSGKEHTAVHTSLHTLEAHVQAVNTTRLRQALIAEQVRLANANRPRGLGKVTLSIRTSMGGALIALGEKLSNQQATSKGVARTPRTSTA
jgi:hypothetical protein